MQPRFLKASATEPKLESLQYIRAIAAWAVVYYHATVYLHLITGFKGYFDLVQGRPGVYGVTAFFVVSGYLMASIAPKYDAKTFLVHRILRIYPIYWVCVVFAWIFYKLLWQATLPNTDWVPNLSHMLYGGDAYNLLRLTLVPVVFPDAPLGIEWTLLYETTFYVLVFTLIVAGQIRNLHFWAIGWLLLIVATTLLRPEWQANHTRPTLATFLFQVPNVAFILGMLGARYQQKLNACVLLATGVILMALIEFFSSQWAMHQVCAGIAAIVLGIVGLERRGWLGYSSTLARLGAWSYALYLLHVLTIFTVLKLTPGWAPLAQLCVIAGFALLLCFLFGKIDVSSYRGLKRAFDGGPIAAKTALTTLFLLMFGLVGAAGIAAIRA